MGGGVAGLPLLPSRVPKDPNTAFVSLADASRLHTAWTQELHADGQLVFTITWLFSKTRTLSERLEAMRQPGGEGVTWYIFSPRGQLLSTKIGSWRTPRHELWPSERQDLQNRQEWAIDVLWGAANGPVGSYEGSSEGGFAMPTDFWGQGSIEANANVWCERYWMQGIAYKALDVVNEIRLETSPLVALPVGR